MFSSLFGDLPKAKGKNDASADGSEQQEAAEEETPGSWSAAPRLVPLRRPPSSIAPPALLRNNKRTRLSSAKDDGGANGGRNGNDGANTAAPAAAAPAAGGARSGAMKAEDGDTNDDFRAKNTKNNNNTETATTTLHDTSSIRPNNAQAVAASTFGEGVKDAYDPARPNDYAQVRQRRERARLEAEAEAARQEERRRALLDHGEMDVASASGGKYTASERADGGDNDGGGPKGMTLAQKIMEKMGWRKGEGLGRERQGITAPLAVEKTDARSGRVVAQPMPPPPMPPPQMPR